MASYNTSNPAFLLVVDRLAARTGVARTVTIGITIATKNATIFITASKKAARMTQGDTHQLPSQSRPGTSRRRSCAPSTSPVSVDSCDERGEPCANSTSTPICATPLSSGRRKPLATASQPRISHRRVGPMPALDTLDTLLLRARQPCSRGCGVLAARETAPASKRPRRSKGPKLMLERSANEEKSACRL
eukprot:scaffold12837_cov66-Phaeocystis_antarctica.AAC.2